MQKHIYMQHKIIISSSWKFYKVYIFKIILKKKYKNIKKLSDIERHKIKFIYQKLISMKYVEIFVEEYTYVYFDH